MRERFEADPSKGPDGVLDEVAINGSGPIGPNRPSKPSKPSWVRYWGFRVAAMLMGLLPFLVAELILLSVGWQPSNSIVDPYVGFAAMNRLFETSEDGLRWQIAENRKPLFCADSFLKRKPENGFRIFCVGGSTVQGRPFAIETAFSSWMKIGLSTADPERTYEVVNCGGVSYASYRLAPIVEEVVEYQPDLIVIYTGHNEFLEDRTYREVRELSPILSQAHGWFSKLRTYQFLRSRFVDEGKPRAGEPLNDSRFEMPEDVEARLDFQGGLSLYRRDEAWSREVTAHFELNLRRMVRGCRAKGVPVVVVKPVSNLRDAAPFKSEHRGGMTIEELDEFERQMASTERSTASTREQLQRDLVSLKRAVELDGEHALAQFRLGQTYIQLGDVEAARGPLLAAKECDVCPLRATESILKAIEEVTGEEQVLLLDANGFFQRRSPDGIVGQESLVDHVHPSIAGHQRIAEWLLSELAGRRMLPIESSSLETEAYRRAQGLAVEGHLSGLPNLYFELGKDRLAGLKRWASGEVKRVRDTPPGMEP